LGEFTERREKNQKPRGTRSLGRKGGDRLGAIEEDGRQGENNAVRVEGGEVQKNQGKVVAGTESKGEPAAWERANSRGGDKKGTL